MKVILIELVGGSDRRLRPRFVHPLVPKRRGRPPPPKLLGRVLEVFAPARLEQPLVECRLRGLFC